MMTLAKACKCGLDVYADRETKRDIFLYNYSELGRLIELI